MLPSFWKTAVFVGGLLVQLAPAQQYAGDTITNSLPSVPGAEIAYFKINEPTGKTPKAYNLTLTNYQSLQANGKQMVPSQVQRAVIIVHGLQRDPGTYIANIMSALSQVGDPSITRSNVLMMAPYFPNGDDKNYGYPYNATNPAVPGKVYAGSSKSYSGALVWTGSQWSGGGANQYPAAYTTVSSYYVLDQLLQWFGNTANFPNIKEIVIAGHSLGGQTVQRYAAMGQTAAQLGISVPVTYWIANPNSYVWLNSSRPLSTASCPSYDQWRDGLQNFTGYASPAVYNTAVTAGSVGTIQANYFAKNKAYARGLADTGDDSSGCAPEVSGANRNERFFAFVEWFPPTCEVPNSSSSSGHCDTVDLVNIGHDAGAMMASPAGLARLFTDNFNGNGSRAYDFGYPRVEAGDDPFPNPDLATNTTTDSTVYAGNMTSQGCYSDATSTRALTYTAYDKSTNTIELCTSTCNSLGYTVAGVEYGSQCYCGNALSGSTSKVVNSGCSQACAGNSSETCGGSARINIYSNGTPKQLSPPGNPDSVSNGNYNYYNCYSEATSGRALSAKSYSDTTNMTLDSCATFCAGYKYFGVEYAQECYCGGCFNPGSAVIATSTCSMTCTGDSSEYCGAGNALSVYQIDEGSTLKAISQTCGAGSSTTATGTSATSTASSVPSTSLCPSANGQNIVDSNNNTYLVTCSSDSSQGSYASTSAVTSYLDCMVACDSASATGCTGFTYVGGANGSGSGSCYLKTAMGSYSSSGSNLIAAVKVSTGSSTSTVSGSAASASTSITTGVSTSTSAAATSSAVSCPGSDATTYTASNGARFVIECGIDHNGGDMSSQSVPDFASCINACATTTGCVDVSLSGAACYLKSSVGASSNNANVWGAKLVASVSSSSTAKTTSASLSSSSATLSTSSSAILSSSSSAILSSSSSAAPSSSSTSVQTSSTVTSASGTALPSATGTTCPGMDQSSIVDAQGAVYNVYCSADTNSATLSVISTSTGILGCMAGCDSLSGCTAFTYAASDSIMKGGFCYLRTVAPRSSAGATTAVAVQVSPPGSVSVSSSSSSSAVTAVLVQSSSSSSVSSVLTSTGSSISSSAPVQPSSSSSVQASSSSSVQSSSSSSSVETSSSSSVQPSSSASVQPSSSSSAQSSSSSSAQVSSSVSSSSLVSSTVPSTSSSSAAFPSATGTTCPGMDQTSIVDASGATYNVYCAADTGNAILTVASTSTGILGCMSSCDNTAGCTSFTYAGDSTMKSGFCYLRTIGGRSSAGANTAVGVLVSKGSKASSSSSSASTSSTTIQSNANFASQTSSSSQVSSSATSSTAASVSSTSASVSSSSSASPVTSSVSSSSSSVVSSSSSVDPSSSSVDPSSSSVASSSSSVASTSSISSTSSSVSSSATPSTSLSASLVTSTSSSATLSSTTSSSSASVTPIAPATVSNYAYQGCYNDTTSARALRSAQLYGSTSNPMTLEKCAAYCSSYSYWGVEYAQECYCGNAITVTSTNQTNTKGCNMACPGNSTELCGGGNAVNLYSKILSSTTSSQGVAATGSFRRRGMKGMRGT